MPGPEQRRMEKEARRQAALSHLRSVHKLREKQEPRSLSPKKSANVSRDNTSTAAGSCVSPSVVSTTNHTATTIKTTKESKMPIYKYDSPSSASLKRKAKDNDDGSELERGDRPVPGHQTKKAKPTSGYVPGTGKPYKGTARDDPKRATSGLVGVLGNKSTNALLKSRDGLAKQDTKNLNRNAPKPKVLHGTGTSRPTQGQPTQSSPKVEEPKAMDRTYTNGPQYAKRDAPKVAGLGTMEDAKNGPLRMLKRKAGRDFESEAKKPRIGPSTAPPVRKLEVDVNAVPQARTSSFFVHNQKLGHTAAILANVRHVQEVVKEPTTKLPRTPSETRDSPAAKKAESGALGKKRQREDETGSERPKKAKLSDPESTGRKAPSIEEEPKESVAGLGNHDKACFANVGLQGLFGVPELVAHYEACGNKIPDEVQDILKGCPDLMRLGKATREAQKKREVLRSALGDNCCVGAYFGELAKAFKKAAGTGSVSPYVFLEACGTHFKDEEGRPLNGDTSQDSAQFINELLKRLHEEEITERTEIADAQEPSIVQKLFHVQGGKKLVCKKCANVRDIPNQPTADCYGLNVILPTSKAPTTLGELLEHARTSELLEDHPCPNCKTMDTTTQDVYFKKLPKYLIVQAPRARHMEDRNGRYVFDRNYRPIIQKIHTLVKFPAEALDLSSLLSGEESSEVHQYEVFNFVEHKGKRENDGHYVANRKIQGRWHNISDDKIKEIPAEKLLKHNQGQLFFPQKTGMIDFES